MTSQSTAMLEKPFAFWGIDFAPLATPLARRLQALAALYWICSFLIVPLVCTFVLGYLLVCSEAYRWVAVLYLTWLAYDWNTPFNGGRSSSSTRGWKIWKHLADYCPVKLVKTADLDPTKRYLIGNHPHGVLSLGAFSAIGTDACGFHEAFPGCDVRGATLTLNFAMPGWHREVLLRLGAISSTKTSLVNALKEAGRVVFLVVGGAKEALETRPDEVRLYLNKRKGFVKLALQQGVDLVPSFSFNEQKLYRNLMPAEGSWFHRFQMFVESTVGFVPLLFGGRGLFQYSFGIIPLRVPLTVVVGSPIHVERISNPTQDQLDKVHSTYIEALCKLYNKYNPVYGDPDVKLIII